MDFKMLGAGAPTLPKWFDVEALSDTANNCTTITVKLSSSNGGVAIPLSYKVDRGSLTANDIVDAIFRASGKEVTLPKWAKIGLGLVHIPPRIHVTGEPNGPGKAKLSLTCTHAGQAYTWSKDVEFDQVRLTDIADALKFLVAVQSGAVQV